MVSFAQTKNANDYLTLSWQGEVNCQEAASQDFKPTDVIVEGSCIKTCEHTTMQFIIEGDTSLINTTTWQVFGGNFIGTPTTTSCEINWASLASQATLELTINYIGGTTTTITKCIEKLNAPNAHFNVFPSQNETIQVCRGNPISFENLTTINNGHDDIYYRWTFGDQDFSNEFEPTFTFNEVGSYLVTLIATNGCSCESTYSMEVIVTESQIVIDCPSMSCEGDSVSYTIQNAEEYVDCNLEWQVAGGDIIFESNDKTTIQVIWGNQDLHHYDGFGYVSVSARECFECTTTVKIPIITAHEEIYGNRIICENEQATFTLPQWATTDFTWALQNETGTAVLLEGNTQRNQIVVEGLTSGTVTLSATYYNTLLGCGGVTNSITITIKKALTLLEIEPICTNTDIAFTFIDYLGDEVNIPDLTWEIFGPNNIHDTGTNNTGIINYNFTQAGTYNLLATSNLFCIPYIPPIVVNEKPNMPTLLEITNEEIPICPNSLIDYYCNVPNGVTAYWDVKGGEILGTDIGNHIKVIFDSETNDGDNDPNNNYQITVWYENNTCVSEPKTVNLVVDEPDFTGFPTQTLQVCGSTISQFDLPNLSPENTDFFQLEIIPANRGSVFLNTDNEIEVQWNQFASIKEAQIKLKVRKCGIEYEQISAIITISPSPTITNTTTNTTVCALENKRFSFALASNFNTNDITQVIWNFGDGTEVILQNTPIPTHYDYQYSQVAQLSNYTATVSVTVGNCLLPATIDIPITVNPAPIADVTPNTIIFCALRIFNITQANFVLNTQNIQDSTIQWYKDEVVIPNETGLVLTVNDTFLNQDYIYRAKVTNSFGCVTWSDPLEVIGDCEIDEPIECDNEVVTLNAQIDCESVAITSTITGTNYTVNWGFNIPSAVITTQEPNNNLTLTNLIPGVYGIGIRAIYNTVPECEASNQIDFLIPYKAALRYEINCNTTGGYDLVLYDHSAFYPTTPYNQVEFTKDGGVTWTTQSQTNSNGIKYHTYTNLSESDIVNLGVRISGYPNYTCTTSFVAVAIPPTIDASFTISCASCTSSNGQPNYCEGTAIHFTPTYPQNGYQYSWDFNDGTSNLSQNTFRVYDVDGPDFKYISLTITNPYGCQVTSTQAIYLLNSNMGGALVANPTFLCEGNMAGFTMAYAPKTSTEPVTQLDWYLINSDGSHNPTPVATTTAPNLAYTTSQAGQYFVYATNASGCIEQDISPTTIAYIPQPSVPLITGQTEVCFGQEIRLSVPSTAALSYTWAINGNPVSGIDPTNELVFTPTTAGVQQITVFATNTNNGLSCTGDTTTYNVLVLDEIQTPTIQITNVICEPYTVGLKVANAASFPTGTVFNWSNGGYGNSTNIYHDGPVLVTAGVQGCSQASDTFALPIDLTALDWTFPKGCYNTCQTKELPDNTYLIGPIGEFKEWAWLANAVPYIGVGEVANFSNLLLDTSYQLYLNAGYCQKTFGDLSFETYEECKKCNLDVHINSLNCTKINGLDFYEIEFVFEGDLDPSANHVFHVTTPNQEGYFVPSSFTFTENPTFVNVLFVPNTSYFVPNQDFVLSIQGSNLENNCLQDTAINLPNCNEAKRVHTKLNSLFVVPNPAQNTTQLVYHSITKGKLQIQITSALGIPVYQQNLLNNQGVATIDISRFAKGIYTVRLLQNSTQLIQQKLIVK